MPSVENKDTHSSGRTVRKGSCHKLKFQGSALMRNFATVCTAWKKHGVRCTENVETIQTPESDGTVLQRLRLKERSNLICLEIA